MVLCERHFPSLSYEDAVVSLQPVVLYCYDNKAGELPGGKAVFSLGNWLAVYCSQIKLCGSTNRIERSRHSQTDSCPVAGCVRTQKVHHRVDKGPPLVSSPHPHSILL